MTTQIVNGAGDQTPTIDDWRRGTLLTADGHPDQQRHQGQPVAGGRRLRRLARGAAGPHGRQLSAIRIYLSTEVTDRKLYTLMHDPQYRVEVARQQTTYNQPSYPGFYLASDIDWSEVPRPRR